MWPVGSFHSSPLYISLFYIEIVLASICLFKTFSLFYKQYKFYFVLCTMLIVSVLFCCFAFITSILFFYIHKYMSYVSVYVWWSVCVVFLWSFRRLFQCFTYTFIAILVDLGKICVITQNNLLLLFSIQRVHVYCWYEYWLFRDLS